MTQDAKWFEALYCDATDPWSYRTSRYEAQKYADTLALLPRARYKRALEIGCSIGEMSKLIAQRSERLLALDFAPSAISDARELKIPNADFIIATVPRDWPRGPWDLIVMSEILYYLDSRCIDELAECIARDLSPDGQCLLVNYAGETQTALSGIEAESCLLHSLSNRRAVQMGGQIDDLGRGYRAMVLSLNSL
ncbi:SAM-dependent methyltransferase [Frigidibacter sp. MR17.14]|uniref:class I SAM-dependent methyltransferase n=1 Tax=Frigidibacter sp. MR17.14 TaxID=3126509 RepID=UPI00301307D0